MKRLSFVLFLLATLAGCATTYPPGISEFADNEIEELISDTDGLTLTGCAAFFPRERAVDCLSRWQSRSLEERYAYLRLNGSPLVRGFWRSVVLTANAEVFQERLPQGETKTVADIRSELIRIGQYPITDICGTGKTLGEQDTCMFLLGDLATEAEMRDASIELARLEQQPPVLRQPLPRMRLHFPPHRPRVRWQR